MSEDRTKRGQTKKRVPGSAARRNKSMTTRGGAMPPIPKDIALLHGPTEDGKGARMLRLKEGTLYAGEVRPVREGQDIARQEVVRLKPIPNEAYAGQLCEVETLHAPSATADVKARSGPARVSNKSYRKNWGAVFGKSASGSRAQKKARQDYSVN